MKKKKENDLGRGKSTKPTHMNRERVQSMV